MISMRLFSDDAADRRGLRRAVAGYNQATEGMILELTYCGRKEGSIGCTDVDLLFMDVRDGDDIKALRRIRSENPSVELVVLSDGRIAADRYVVPAIRPLLLLKKPLDESTLMVTIHKLCRFLYEKQEESGFVHRFIFQDKTRRRYFPYSSIHFFETRNKKVVLNTRQKEYEFYDSFAQMEKYLPQEFIRCHRSYMVNATHVISIDPAHYQIELDDHTKIPISKKYRRHAEMVFEQMRSEESTD